jgi:ParB-like chromosome segregation protein Spo0J
MPQLKLEYWDIDRLREYDKNPRKNDHVVETLASAIDEFGFRVPILAKSNGLIVDGHLRLKSARALGMVKVPVIVCDDMSEDQIRAFRISVNQISGEFDFDLLTDELKAIDLSTIDVMLTGFDENELNRIINGFETQQFPPTDEQHFNDDEKSPRWVACPHCGKEFDVNSA